jgi:UTP--glucose-1-phosphate uridylyltransferase
VERVPKEDVSRYGIIALGEALEDGIFRVDDLVEKPEPEDAPSDYAIIGRYLLTPEIFTYLRETKPDAKGEIQLTDALRRYNREHGMVGVELKGTRLDVGGMEGWLMANIKAAMIRDPTLAERIKKGL